MTAIQLGMFADSPLATVHPACRLNYSRGPATDIRLWWPACTRFTERSP